MEFENNHPPSKEAQQTRWVRFRSGDLWVIRMLARQQADPQGF